MEIIEKEDSNSNRSLLSICCWIIAIGCIALIILVGVEIVFFSLLKLISYYGLIAVLLDVVGHLLFIRYLVVQISFAGQFYVILKQTYYSVGFFQGKYISKHVLNLENDLIKFNSRNIRDLNEYKELKKSIKRSLDLIRYYISVFQQMCNKYGNLTQIQNKFLRAIIEVNDIIVDAKLTEFIANDISNIKTNKRSTISYLTNNNDKNNEELLCFSNVINNTLLPSIREIQKILNDYTDQKMKWYSIKKIRTVFFTEFLGSLKQQRIELTYEFEYEEFTLETEDKNTIDYIIIKGQNATNNIKNNLMIICGPNGASFELFSKNIRLRSLYLEKNCDVLCWNYRGYGFSTGKATFDNIKRDAIKLYDTVAAFNRWNKIGVHGISIGGIPCCHLARKKTISLLVSDRNFGSIDLIANSLRVGNCLVFLYKLLLLPDSYTIDDYINSNCYKILLNDPNDMIVRESSSLKTNISRYIIQKYLNLDNQNDPTLMISTRRLQFRNKSCSKQFAYNNYKDILDLIFTSKQKDNFMSILIELANIMVSNSFEQSIQTKCSSYKCCKKNQYKNLKEEELQNTSGLFDFVKFKLGDFFYAFTSAGDSLATLIDITNTRLKHIFISNFFSNFIIWGNKKANANIFSIDEAIDTLKESIEVLNFILSTQEVQNNKTHYIILSIQEMVNYLKKIELAVSQLNVTKSNILPTQLLNNSINNLNTSASQILSLNEQLIHVGKGNLIHLKCGHNGALNGEEFSILIEQIHLSGFFNDH